MAEGKLKEVERDATRITTKRFHEYFEELEYQAEQKKQEEAAKPEESDKKGNK